jgi:hypothetical protein
MLSQFKEKNMEKTIQLIDGAFSSQNAHEILTTLIMDKIKYHNLRILRMKEKGNKEEAEQSEERILELKATKQDVRTFLNEFQSSDIEIEIKGQVHIRAKR